MRFAISFVCLAGIAAMPVHAQSAEVQAARAPFEACGRIADKDARVACFDRALSAGETPAPQREAAAPPPPMPAPAPQRQADNFGMAGSPAAKQQRLKAPKAATPATQNRVDLQVTRATVNGLGRWTIEAASGAIWRQTETVPNFIPPRNGDAVYIESGALGTYLLRVGKQPFTRVERVR